jgi:hypothetical protein
MSENRVLRRVFGPKREEVVGGWTRLHNEELRYLYYSPNIIRDIISRRMIWAERVAHMGEKRPLGRPTRRWEDNIRTGFIWLRIGTCGGVLL